MSNLPILKREDEEFQMLLEVAKQVNAEFAYQVKAGEKTKPHMTSGQVTESVIREHLQSHGLNVSQNRVSINPSAREIDLLVLKEGINSDKRYYSPSEVHTVLEIRNNAVGSADRNPNVMIKDRFNDLENVTKVNRFAVVILSENPNYKWRITTERIGKENCQVFTCAFRKKFPNLDQYYVDAINRMIENREIWKTGEWDGFLEYLNRR